MMLNRTTSASHWKSARRVLVFGLAAGLAMRWLNLSNQSLWYDEGTSIILSQGKSLQDVADGIFHCQTSEALQPLYFAILYGWRSIFGSGETALRGLSAVLGCAGLILAVLSGLRAGGRFAGAASALVASLSSYHVLYSQEVRPYGLLMALAAAQLWWYLRCISSGDNGKESGSAWWILGLISSLLSLASVFGLLCTCALALADATRGGVRKSNWVRSWLTVAGCCLPGLAYLAAVWLWARPASAAVSLLKQSLVFNVAFGTYGLMVGPTYGPPLSALRGDDRFRALLEHSVELFILAVSAAALAWVASRVVARKSGTIRTLSTFLGIHFLLFVGFGAATHLNLQPRHLACAWPTLVVVLGLIASEGFESRTEGWGRVAVACCCTLAALNGYSTYKYFTAREHSRDDYRAAAGIIHEVSGRKVPVLILWGNPDLLRYYGAERIVDGRQFEAADIGGRAARELAGANLIMVAVNREFYWKSPGKVEESFSPQYRCRLKWKMQNFNLYLLEFTGLPRQAQKRDESRQAEIDDPAGGRTAKWEHAQL